MNEKSLNLREALRQARERANRERNRAKCKQYYRKRLGKGALDTVRKDDPEKGAT